MKTQRIAVILTAVNLLLIIVLLTKLNPVTAQKENKSEVLRGTGLEITDNQGRLRASITFQTPEEKDGTRYPGGILLRLINTNGQPSVKIMASEEGGGLSFSNEANGYIQLLANESGGFLKIKNADGKEQIIKPYIIALNRHFIFIFFILPMTVSG
jgi:hypothetical protein